MMTPMSSTITIDRSHFEGSRRTSGLGPEPLRRAFMVRPRGGGPAADLSSD
jgi:hypothetical protein